MLTHGHVTGLAGATLRRALVAGCVACALAYSAHLHAQEPALTSARAGIRSARHKCPSPISHAICRHWRACALLPVANASVEQLRLLVAEGERLYLAGRDDEAALLLLEAVESPRFTDFQSFDEYAAAEHMAGSALLRLGSLKTARRYLERVIERGPREHLLWTERAQVRRRRARLGRCAGRCGLAGRARGDDGPRRQERTALSARACAL